MQRSCSNGGFAAPAPAALRFSCGFNLGFRSAAALQLFGRSQPSRAARHGQLFSSSEWRIRASEGSRRAIQPPTKAQKPAGMRIAMEKPCREPRLDELFEDSAMRLLMASDKVDEAALRALIASVVEARPVSAWQRCSCWA
jgi:hypothetical protein